MTDRVYLKPNVVAEPLFNQWYAWPYLIPPASAALFVANAHLKIMDSFAAAPQVHVAALKNPAMLGGPFIGYGPERAADVRRLAESTRQRSAPLLELAAAVAALEEMLAAEARGFSMEGLYRRVPDPLRGYVELVYDLRNNPSVRFIEPLLYRSRFYDESLQALALWPAESDQRPFVFSTPRLRDDGRAYLDVPFRHHALDQLFGMRARPGSYHEVRDALGVGADDRGFAALFTETAPPAVVPFREDGVRVRYFGHACVLIETRDVSLLCDPVVSYPVSGDVPRYSFNDLPEHIDYVLLTHAHQDHVLFEMLLQLRHRIGTVVVPRGGGGGRMDPSLALILETVGFPRVQEIGELQELRVPGGAVVALPFLGEHADLAIRTKSAYAVRLGEATVVLAADSNNLEPRLYDAVAEVVGSPDLLFLGMECDGAPMSWLYGPLVTVPIARKDDQSRRFNASDYEAAIAMVDSLRPREAYVYAMGMEPWCTFLTSLQYGEASRPIVESDRIVAECRRRGIAAERLFGRREWRLRG
jgi:L-ascorbate metabolism protein UlaG (beta-lactamase superfamily)